MCRAVREILEGIRADSLTTTEKKGNEMGRKRRLPKLLLSAVMLSTLGAGIFGGVPLSVRAEEEGTYTVVFEAYEGQCDTGSVTVPKGESITLPDGTYEGHYLESWMDAVKEEGMVTFLSRGKPGDSYTPDRDVNLYANWKPNQGQEITVIYEAKIGDTGYEELEEAFANAQDGDTITVLKDCRVASTLEVTADNITLQSEDAGNPVTISREEGFTGNSYGTGNNTVLLAVTGNSFSTQDIVFDGGAVLDGDFNNTGSIWNSPLIYVNGSYTMGSGTVLQNNYNTDGNGGDGGRPFYTAGALFVEQGGSLTMDEGLIQSCYAAGAGGGIQSEKDSHVTAVSGTVRGCYAAWGGGMYLQGNAELSGMTFSGNSAGSTGGGLYSRAPLTLADSLIEGNSSGYDGGGLCTTTGHRPVLDGCTFTDNVAGRGSAIQTLDGEGTEPLEIRDCTFTGNRSTEKSYAGGAICYMNETGIILYGNIVMEDNLAVGASPCDILFFYNTGASILLDESFESGSTFVLGGFPDVLKPGRVLVDGKLYGKDASPEQFPWHTKDFCTEKRGDNLYLAEVPKTYSIIYDANNNGNGESSNCFDPDEYTSDDKAVIMDDLAVSAYMGTLANAGYDFAGWNTEADGTGTDYLPGQEISLTENLYLYAKWEAKEPVTITFVYNDGKVGTDSTKAVPGSELTFPDAARKGYDFMGWYADKELTVLVGNGGDTYTVPQEDITYYAAWEKSEVTVTFDVDGGEMEGGDITAKIGDTITLPGCTKDNFIFTGWYDGDTLAGKAGEKYTVLADVTLKARYEKEKEEEKPVICTVTFDADGGETVRKSISTEKGSAIILPLCNKAGYEFLGWFLSADETVCVGQAGEEFAVQSDITLKAHFEKKEAVKVTITFDIDGGNAVKPIKAEKGDTIRLPKTEKEGYSFLGWYTEKDGGILLGIPGSEMKAVKDMTAYALWEKEAAKGDENGKDDTAPETCKVNFHAGKGIIKVKELTIIKDGSLYLPLPERKEYDFAGWYLDDKLTQFAGAYRDTYRITKDTDFYAKWQKAEDSNSGDSGNSGNTGDNDGNGGGSGNGSGSGIESGDGTPDEDNSGENLNTYTIKYDANGGKTKNASVKVVKGGSVKLPGAEREGYTFKGWYTDRQVFIGTEGEAYKPGRSISLYARWEKTEKNGQGNQDSNSVGNTNGKDDKSTSDKNKDTSGTVSGNSAGSLSDKNKDTNASTKTEGGNGNDGKGSEPVIQTGYASPFAFLATLGLCGAVLIGASVLEAKKGRKGCL